VANVDAALKLDARPDRLDLRDLLYQPPLRSLPPHFPDDAAVAKFLPSYVEAKLIRNQGNEGSCTGFGLACVMDYLFWTRAGRKFQPVSSRMLYEMAKRYDEWPGIDYQGSSCRGALKGLHKHGVCSEELWPYNDGVFVRPKERWDVDAATRPLGVYYRVRRESVVDLQAAILNIGAIYVSGNVHDGWLALLKRDAPPPATHAALPLIGPRKKEKPFGGHAFALVGYNERGFVVQNSWGVGWGASGFAILPYDEWIQNGTDAWALALGVPVQLPQPGSAALTARRSSRWQVASGTSLTTVARNPVNPHNPPDDPWPIDHLFDYLPYEPWSTDNARGHALVSGNEGVLDVSDHTRAQGDSEGHAAEIVHDRPLAWFRQKGGRTLKLALYAHGGLNSEEESIARSRVLGPYFEENGIYPIFLTWKTSVGETLVDIIEDCARKLFGVEIERAAGLSDILGEQRDRAVETMAHVFAKGIWTQMRENADASRAKGRALDLIARNLALLAKDAPLELHFVGHSAGSILLGHLLERMMESDLKAGAPHVATCSLFAAACSVEFAVNRYLPAADNGLLDLDQLWLQFLSEENEKKDGLPTPTVALYGKSLLYLVSRALEDERKTALLGMERALDPKFVKNKDQWGDQQEHWLTQWQLRWPATRGIPEKNRFVRDTREGHQQQATHGSFDNNIPVITQAIERIKGSPVVKPLEWLDY
jgi:hypothetical protein